MRVLPLLKGLSKRLINSTKSGIDFIAYLIEEFRNKDRHRSEWQTGEIQQITSSIPERSHANSPKTNIRLLPGG